jgi:hypothetical protein
MNQFTQEAVHEEMLNIWRKEHRRTSEDVFKQLKEATLVVCEDLFGYATIGVTAHLLIRGTHYQIIYPTNDWTRDSFNGRKIECKIGKCLWYCSRWRIIVEYK